MFRPLMVGYEELHNTKEKEKLPERVKQLERMIQGQMQMIQEQQMLIDTQKHVIENQKNANQEKSFDDCLDNLIDREEHCNDSDEDYLLD